jgi:pyridoxamine 5'-phosphate oxidase
MNLPLADLRQDYKLAGLTEAQSLSDPFQQFSLWFEQALNAELLEPNAMTLATIDSNGSPNARIVLLKGFSENGLIFHTNYDSAKGQNIAANPQVALVFWWGELERQVRIEGTAEKVSAEDSDSYFSSRPLNSQIGSWASTQSQVVSSREELESRFAHYQEKFNNQPIPRPENWGGYRVVPYVFEFWQGRPSRLHDRLRYRLSNQQWIRERLCP